MTHLKDLRRYLGFGALILILLVLIWLRVSYKAGPDTTKSLLPVVSITPADKNENSIRKIIVPASNVSLDNNVSVTYSGAIFTAPKTLSAYTGGDFTETTEIEARRYAQLFSFGTNPNLVTPGTKGSPVYFWKEGSRSFSIGGSFPMIQYNNFVESDPTLLLPKEEEIINKATNELTRIGIKRVDTNSPIIEYYKQEVEELEVKRFSLQRVVNSDEATHFGVGFDYLVEDYSIFAETYPRPPVYIVLDRNFKVYSFTSLLVNLSRLEQSIPVTSFNKALESLATKGILFSASSKENINEESGNTYILKSMDFKEVKLAYFLPTSYVEYVIPVYIFEGIGREVSNNSEVGIVVVLPVDIGS